MLNESSLWSGWAAKDNDRPGAYQALVKTRQLVRDGKRDEAGKVAVDGFLSRNGYGKPDFGAYQAFCDAWFDFEGLSDPPGAVTEYRRDLDLATATAHVAYRVGDAVFRREYFCSYPDQVLMARFTSTAKGRISFKLGLTSPHKIHTVTATGNRLVLAGRVNNGKNNPDGMTFEACLVVEAEGGAVTASGSALVVAGADAVTVKMVGATHYKLAYPDYRGEAPAVRNIRTLAALEKKTFADLRAAHQADHKELFGRVTLVLGREDEPAGALPTDERVKQYRKTRTDRALEALMFQYGRYLLIASSRRGGLPANLQGLWNNSNNPPWNCDYHLNINLQMNYWPAESCALPECALPLMDWLTDLRQPGGKTADIHYHSRGWVVHHVANVWGFTAPGSNRGLHMMEAESAAFICNNVWEHFAFTGDRDYLKTSAWPLMKGAAEFWMDTLQELPDGRLVVSPAFSPEHGPLTGGAYYQIMIVHDLFLNCIEAGEVLGGEQDFCDKLRALQARLAAPRVGKFGQLCEWLDDDLETNVRTDKHRHVSHMFAVYPGRQITVDGTPDLAKAAVRSLNYRGDVATGWSSGWKINLWARLGDGDRAWTLASSLLARYAAPNLFDLHPPFQIDGNFGYTAGIAEMLVQSRACGTDSQIADRKSQKRPELLDLKYEILLLPALPKAWADGKVTGLRTRGNFTVDMEWENGRVTALRITHPDPRQVLVRYNGETKLMVAEKR